MKIPAEETKLSIGLIKPPLPVARRFELCVFFFPSLSSLHPSLPRPGPHSCFLFFFFRYPVTAAILALYRLHTLSGNRQPACGEPERPTRCGGGEAPWQTAVAQGPFPHVLMWEQPRRGGGGGGVFSFLGWQGERQRRDWKHSPP